MEIPADIAIKSALALSLFAIWVIIEETIIDRHGLWKYMPFYKVGIPCLWDIIAGVLILGFVFFILRIT